MRKAEQKAIFSDILKLIVCVATLTITTIIVFQRVERYDQKGINKDTYNAYCNSIWFMLAVVIFLLAGWYVMAYGRCKLREAFERYTLVYALVFAIGAFGIAAYIDWRYPGIERTNGTLMPLWYVFCYPCAFCFVLFSAVPSNICKVIIPYRNWIKWIVAVVFLAALYLLLRV